MRESENLYETYLHNKALGKQYSFIFQWSQDTFGYFLQAFLFKRKVMQFKK